MTDCTSARTMNCIQRTILEVLYQRFLTQFNMFGVPTIAYRDIQLMNSVVFQNTSFFYRHGYENFMMGDHSQYEISGYGEFLDIQGRLWRGVIR